MANNQSTPDSAVCFFFQAEDGIRDRTVTGVQTCALPISFLSARVRERLEDDFPEIVHTLVGLLWPQLLRPFPSASIVTQIGRASCRERVEITEVGGELKKKA